MAPEASPNTARTPSEMQSSYWRPNAQDSPMTPAFSPYTPGLQIPPPQNWPTSQAEAPQRDELSWSVPQRSMSYSNLENSSSHAQYPPYHHPAQGTPMPDHFQSKPRTMQTGMFPPPLTTSSNILPPPETATLPSDPHSASPHYPGWQQSYPYQKPAGEPYSAWSSGGTAHIPEETHAPAYNYGEPSSSLYYPPPPQGR